MQTNDYEKLARHLVAALTGTGLRIDVAPSRASNDAASLAQGSRRNMPAGIPLEIPAVNTRGGSSAAGSVVKLLARGTGLGPLATGLISLFGGRGKEAEPVPPAWYDPPAPLAIEAGLDARREFTPLAGYSAAGVPRSAGGAPAAAGPVVQVNVQAMDSRSFLDHSDEIARAVKEAMLHSHGLNDVVTEI